MCYRSLRGTLLRESLTKSYTQRSYVILYDSLPDFIHRMYVRIFHRVHVIRVYTRLTRRDLYYIYVYIYHPFVKRKFVRSALNVG